MLLEALRIAGCLGRIIPQHYPTPAGCSCGTAECDNEGKHPAVPRGIAQASDDPKVVREWWKSRPWNIGALALGWWALDVDVSLGGPEMLERLVQSHGPLPVTPEQVTGSGGRHFIFAHDSRLDALTIGSWMRGLELKANGRGTITVAPSLHASGRRYQWLPGRAPWEVRLAPAPSWLVELIVERKRPRPVAPLEPLTREVSYEQRLERARRYAERMDPAISGAGGHARTFVACQKIVRGFDLRPADALSILEDWNRSCQPPWSTSELKRKINEAARCGQIRRGAMLSDWRAA